MIRIPQVRVVDDEGTQLGVMPTAEALRLAQERGLDLVEVAPMAQPPVTRLLDYGQFKYEQARREKEARRHQRSVDFKEIRLKVKIGRGDFDTKVRRAIQFLESGDRVKVTCQFRGREVSHAHLGRDLLNRFAEQVGEHGVVERQPILEGRSMSLVIASTHKPKVQPPSRREEREDQAAGAAEGEAEPPPQAKPEAAAKPPEAAVKRAEAAGKPPEVAATREARTQEAKPAQPARAEQAGEAKQAEQKEQPSEQPARQPQAAASSHAER